MEALPIHCHYSAPNPSHDAGCPILLIPGRVVPDFPKMSYHVPGTEELPFPSLRVTHFQQRGEVTLFTASLILLDGSYSIKITRAFAQSKHL